MTMLQKSGKELGGPLSDKEERADRADPQTFPSLGSKLHLKIDKRWFQNTLRLWNNVDKDKKKFTTKYRH